MKGFSRGISTNQVLFKEDILKPIVKVIHSRREGLSIEGHHIHFDDAPADTPAKTTQYLKKTKLKKAIHLAFSPDLSPCDFLFFGYCKNKLKGMKINDISALLEKVLHSFSEVTFEELQLAFKDWMKRLNTVIEINGDVLNELLY